MKMNGGGVHIQEFAALEEAKRAKHKLIFSLGSPPGTAHYKIRPVPNSYTLELCWTEGDGKAEGYAITLERFLDREG